MGPILLGAVMVVVGVLGPWWRLRVTTPDGTSDAEIIGFRGWAGWIVFLLAVAASAAGLRALAGGDTRRVGFAGVLASGSGAAILFTCGVASVDRTGALALDLGAYADLAGVSTAPRWGLGLALAGGLLLLLGGLRASRRPHPPGTGDPEALASASGEGPGEDRTSG